MDLCTVYAFVADKALGYRVLFVGFELDEFTAAINELTNIFVPGGALEPTEIFDVFNRGPFGPPRSREKRYVTPP